MIMGRIEGANLALGKPADMTDEQCATLYVKRVQYACGATGMVSAWFPTPPELAAMQRGEPVYLTVMGEGHPPVHVGVKGVNE